MDADEALDAQSQPTFAAATTGAKDPRKIARKYQLELCKRAVEENVIVYLETGCGKTHIAVLLIYELGHLIRKPQKSVCVFLAPTVQLVRQQATVIEDSTDFKVGSYVGNSRHLKNHHDWAKEIEQLEILVMTPQVLLRNLEHCFIRMELIALLIFDECHHAQTQSRHPYAQILKEFYKNSTTSCPRIFGMTASPIVGKGGSSQADYSKSINSLENLLDAKVYTVEDREELESLVASPNMRVYFYGPVVNSASSLSYHRKLEDIKNQCILHSRGKSGDLSGDRKKIKLLWKAHEKLVFCLENLGLCGGRQAAQMLLSNHCEVPEMEPESSKNDSFLEKLYLTQVPSVFNFSFVEDGIESDYFHPEALEEPFFSKKLLLLIQILSGHRLQEDKKCIVFVKRVIVAKSLAYILGNVKTLEFWKSEFLVGVHCKKMKTMSRGSRNETVEKFRSGQVNLLVATNVAEEGLDIPTCCLVIRFDLPESVTSFIQSRGRARMQQSEYVFLVERENQHEINLINDFTYNENRMNKEISSRTCDEKFDNLEERRYKVNKTGASISTGSCVSLLHHYCSKLPRDEYYTPTPDVFYIDDLCGIICRIILPPNAPIRQVESQPSPSKDEAKRNACLKACEELHVLGCLTDFLLPGQDQEEGSAEKTIKSDGPEDDSSRGELHEMLIPSALRVPWTGTEIPVSLNFYFIKLTPVPEDRTYIDFGFFVTSPLPKEAETMSVDLHLAHGRIVKAEFIPSGIIEFEKDEITHAQNFQEMWLKIVDITDRNEFFSDFVPLGGCASVQRGPSTSYLLLPVKNNVNHDKMIVDWDTVRGCLSSPVFKCPTATDRGVLPLPKTLEFADGAVDIREIRNSLVATSHNKLLFCVVDILYETNGYTLVKDSEITYMEHFKSLNIELSHPEQPLLKAKQLFNLRNLLYNRLQKNRGAREQMEHFVELPPEVCSFKIIGFSKYIASTLSLLPSIMHRLENLLVAIELKDMLSVSFPEGSEISASRVLEALTTEKCSERFSLERLEVLGDAFLKYAVGRHLFLSYESLDEGKLTGKRSSTVNNSHLCELAIKNNLQVYIRDQLFDPDRFFALGHPCRIICTKDTEKMVHFSNGSGLLESDADPLDVRCNRNHHWLHRKTIADVVEALVGAYIVDSGFKAAKSFLKWIGIQVDFKISDVSQVYLKSVYNMSLLEVKNIDGVEILLDYKFVRKGLLLQAFTHPSYNKHSGGCYQRLEFLGDAVLDYLITSYLYSAYPDLKPGQLTDLRSMVVNNKSFALVAVSQSFQSYLISDSSRLTKDINKFANYVQLSTPERDQLEEPRCPKVLGDLVESCVGAVLLDTGFDLKRIWTVMLKFLHPIMKFSGLHLSPIRELREFCQSEKFEVYFPSKKTDGGTYQVEAVIDIKGKCLTGTGININKKMAEKMACQDALRLLKAQGYRFKTKSLDEIVRVSRREEAKLIGYDETPIIVDAPIPIQLEKLQEAEDVASSSSPISSSSTNSNGNSTTYSKALIKGSTATPKRVGQHPRHPRGLDGESTWINDEQTAGTPYKGSAKSRLHEICAANYWKQPSFLRCKEEGPSHMKLFTYKVTVEIEEATPIILEGFSEPRPKKKAAKEHAAEGALWYLRHLGY